MESLLLPPITQTKGFQFFKIFFCVMVFDKLRQASLSRRNRRGWLLTCSAASNPRSFSSSMCQRGSRIHFFSPSRRFRKSINSIIAKTQLVKVLLICLEKGTARKVPTRKVLKTKVLFVNCHKGQFKSKKTRKRNDPNPTMF